MRVLLISGSILGYLLAGVAAMAQTTSINVPFEITYTGVCEFSDVSSGELVYEPNENGFGLTTLGGAHGEVEIMCNNGAQLNVSPLEAVSSDAQDFLNDPNFTIVQNYVMACIEYELITQCVTNYDTGGTIDSGEYQIIVPASLTIQSEQPFPPGVYEFQTTLTTTPE